MKGDPSGDLCDACVVPCVHGDVEVMRNFSEFWDASEEEDNASNPRNTTTRSRKRGRAEAHHCVRWMMDNDNDRESPAPACSSMNSMTVPPVVTPSSSAGRDKSALRSSATQCVRPADRPTASIAASLEIVAAPIEGQAIKSLVKSDVSPSIAHHSWGSSSKRLKDGRKGTMPGNPPPVPGIMASTSTDSCARAGSGNTVKGKHGLTALEQEEEDGENAVNRPGGGGAVGEGVRGGNRGLFGRVVVGASPWNAAVVTPGDGNFERFSPSAQVGPYSPQTMRRRQVKLLDQYMEVGQWHQRR